MPIVPPLPANQPAATRSQRARLVRRWEKLRRSGWVRLRTVRRLGDRVAGPAAGPAQTHLSWSDDPQSTLTVTWCTRSDRAPASVEIGPVDHAERRSVVAVSTPSPGARGVVHRAVVHDLVPDTAYSYRVSGDPDWAPRFGDWHIARTAPPARGATVRALFFGDTGIAGRRDGTTRAHAGLFRELAKEEPHVILGGGDYAYANRDSRFRDHADAIDEWFQQFEPMLSRAPFMPQFGNHEVEIGERYEDWSERLTLPSGTPDGRSYSFDLGAAHFVSLYAPGRAPRPEDLAWLESDLKSERARRASFRIVYQHAPLISSGSSHPARREVAALLQHFDDLGVDLHLSAHDQNYERTYALRNGHITRPAARVSNVDRFTAGQGLICAKISPAGKLSERGGDFSRFVQSPHAFVARRNDAHHHWGRLEISDDVLGLQVDGVSRDGSQRERVDDIMISLAPAARSRSSR